MWWACSLPRRGCWVCSFSPLRLALAQMPEWAGKAHLGPRNQEKPPAPSILVPLLLPLRSHSCSENIVADTQQDDLLAVIHGESSQAGFFFFSLAVINLYVKFETQQKLSQIKLFDALIHGYRMRKKCVYLLNKYVSVPTRCKELFSLECFLLPCVT